MEAEIETLVKGKETSGMEQERVDEVSRWMGEYQAAQNSAQHHDTLIWTTTGITWAANGALMGFALQMIKDGTHVRKFGVCFVACLGIILIWFAWILMVLWGRLRSNKYARCRELEGKLGFRQHTAVDGYYKAGTMRILYTVVSYLLTFGWFFPVWKVGGIFTVLTVFGILALIIGVLFLVLRKFKTFRKVIAFYFPDWCRRWLRWPVSQ